ncbi:uncharacterized protein [Antedon mediterranea]|uniref:uncharacterized protein n=1 Tax=Antedon mediterranea TaxID=105859 RepID=UPI003AF4F2EB
MDEFGLAVFGLPVAAFGVRVVKDYLDSSSRYLEKPEDPSTSGTVVDLKNSGTSVDLTGDGNDVDAHSSIIVFSAATTPTINGTILNGTASGTAAGLLTVAREPVLTALTTCGNTSVDVGSFTVDEPTREPTTGGGSNVSITGGTAANELMANTFKPTRSGANVDELRACASASTVVDTLQVTASSNTTIDELHTAIDESVIDYTGKLDSGSFDDEDIPVDSICDNVHDSSQMTSHYENMTSNDEHENECAKFLIKNIDTSCSYESENKLLNYFNKRIEQNDSVRILDLAPNDNTGVLSSEKLIGAESVSLVEERTIASPHDVLYESESDVDSANDASDKHPTSSDIFFSIINCTSHYAGMKSEAATLTDGSSSSIARHGDPRETSVSTHGNPRATNYEPGESNDKEVCPENKTDFINKTPQASDLTPINSIEAYTQTSDSLYCLHNNNNECPRNKVISGNSLKTHRLGQWRHKSSHGQGCTRNNGNENIQSASKLQNGQLCVKQAQLKGNSLIIHSSGGKNRLVKLAAKPAKSNNTRLSAWKPIHETVSPTLDFDSFESNLRPIKTIERRPQLAEYCNENGTVSIATSSNTSETVGRVQVSSETFQQSLEENQRTTTESDSSDIMKVITDSSTQVDLPETPKSPTRQYTVECPVIEPTSPTGKRCMRKMSLEISFVDSPTPLTPTSPDGKDSTDRRRQSWPEYRSTEAEYKLRPSNEANISTINNNTVGSQTTTKECRRKETAPLPPPHPPGRFMYQFAVPRAYVRTVIGKQARVIRRLRLRTGATISVNYPRGFDGCTCTIEGTYSQVLGAVLILRQNFPLLDWSQDEPEQT